MFCFLEENKKAAGPVPSEAVAVAVAALVVVSLVELVFLLFVVVATDERLQGANVYIHVFHAEQ